MGIFVDQKRANMQVFASLLLLATGAAAGAVDLTPDNFNTHVMDSGKNAFVKFLAPW